MPGPLAKHAVQPKADEERHERQDDDDSQLFAIRYSSFSNEHNAGLSQIQSLLDAAPRHCTAFWRLLGALSKNAPGLFRVRTNPD
jgi:hypothetical protein